MLLPVPPAARFHVVDCPYLCHTSLPVHSLLAGPRLAVRSARTVQLILLSHWTLMLVVATMAHVIHCLDLSPSFSPGSFRASEATNTTRVKLGALTDL
jgi:hypothetical protein